MNTERTTFSQHPLVKNQSIGFKHITSTTPTMPADNVNPSWNRTTSVPIQEDCGTFLFDFELLCSSSDSNEDDDYELIDFGYGPESLGKQTCPIRIDSSLDETDKTAPAKKQKKKHKKKCNAVPKERKMPKTTKKKKQSTAALLKKATTIASHSENKYGPM